MRDHDLIAMKAFRQIDIARQLRIPRTTVSAAFNTDKLRPQLQRRILIAAQKMGYRPHLYAQVMRKGRSGLIGIIRSADPASTRVKRDKCAQRAVFEAGYKPFVEDVDWIEQPHEIQRVIDSMLDACVEGVLFMGISATMPASETARLRQRGIPVVSVNGILLPGVVQVRNDVRQGMFDLTRHTLGLGHRRPLLLTRWPSTPASAQWDDESFNWAMRERVAGFCDGVIGHGGTVKDADDLLMRLRIAHRYGHRFQPCANLEAEIMVEPPESDWIDCFRVGKTMMEKILARPQRPSVVLCHNDFWAIGALAACAEAGVRVPDDISLTGFDGLLVSEYGSVPLTTAIQPIAAMTGKAVELLADFVRTGKRYKTGLRAKLPYQIVSRQSCAAPR